jgi:hypothetical protein
VADEPRAPGWYPDPWGGDGERWFDGTSWSRDRVDEVPVPRPGDRPRRRGLGALVAIVVVAAAVGAWFVLAPGDDGASDDAGSVPGVAGASSTTSSTRPEVVVEPYDKGDCATYDQSSDDETLHVVECASPHLIELVEPREVGSDFDHYPGRAEWEYVDATLCAPIVEQYLGTRIDPQGSFLAGSFRPTEASWDRGHRRVECGIIRTDDGGTPGLLTEFTGRVDGAHQYVALAPGTCLPRDADGLGPPVPCAQAHVAEISGAVDLTGRIDHAPSGDELDRLVADDCKAQGGAYLGRPVAGDIGNGWFSITQVSWDAGHRVVECTVSRRPGGSAESVEVTGSLKAG